MRNRVFDDATIALAMELRTAGVCWKLLELCLGKGIAGAVEYAQKHGMAYNNRTA